MANTPEHKFALPATAGGYDFFIECPSFSARTKMVLVDARSFRFSLGEDEVKQAPEPGGRHAAAIHFEGGQPHMMDIVLDRIQRHGDEWDITAHFADDHGHEAFWMALWHWHHQRSGGLHVRPVTTPSLPGKELDTEAAKDERIKFLQERTGASLDLVANTRLAPEMLRHNIESLIGEVPVPVGVVGPLLLRRNNLVEEIYVPFATTEGALVASATRGAVALSRSGGACAYALEQRVTRTPSFKLPCVSDALFFLAWIEANFESIRARTRRVSKHAMLLSIQPELFGRQIHLHFIYQTGDAAGQNMVTACTWHACGWILYAIGQFPGISVKDFYVDASLSCDKRISSRAFTQGRGVRVTAEAMLSGDVIRSVLKIEPARLLETYRYWTTVFQAAGNVSGGLNVANTIAAIFTATGQDIASVHESSVAVFYLEESGDDDVYISMTLPNLVIGTVGGGTGLPYQQQCLELMGCVGDHKVARLAEIIAAAAMGLDLSLLSAMAGGHFAQAHERMGRNRPVESAATL